MRLCCPGGSGCVMQSRGGFDKTRAATGTEGSRKGEPGVTTAHSQLVTVDFGGRNGDHPYLQWRALARCGEMDPEIFYAGDPHSTRDAVETCRGCPVRVECRDWAITNDEIFGIWGGLSVVERQRLASRRRLAFLRRWVSRHDWTTPSDPPVDVRALS